MLAGGLQGNAEVGPKCAVYPGQGYRQAVKRQACSSPDSTLRQSRESRNIHTGGYSTWYNALQQNDARVAVVDSLRWIVKSNVRSPVEADALPTSRARPTNGPVMKRASLAVKAALPATTRSRASSASLIHHSEFSAKNPNTHLPHTPAAGDGALPLLRYPDMPFMRPRTPAHGELVGGHDASLKLKL